MNFRSSGDEGDGRDLQTLMQRRKKGEALMA